jgi:hypothetical protein
MPSRSPVVTSSAIGVDRVPPRATEVSWPPAWMPVSPSVVPAKPAKPPAKPIDTSADDPQASRRMPAVVRYEEIDWRGPMDNSAF